MLAVALLLLQIFFRSVLSDDNTHKYVKGDEVTLWVNTIGPYHNPQETYPYYQLPFCKPQHGIETKKRPSGMGEILEGNELRNSGLKLHFAENIENDICQMKLDENSVSSFENAVDNQYWYELIIDDLPMWGMVGEVLRDEAGGKMEKHIFTHRTVTLAYKGNRLIEANLTSESPVKIELGATLRFTYSVIWTESDKSFENRFNRYLEYDFFEHRIHWFSIFNSIMMVIFLCGIVALILLRTLRNDFARYSKEDDLEDAVEESGWKQIHGDAFRAPTYLVLFSALYGTGSQLIFLFLACILYAISGPFLHGNMYEDRGELMSAMIISYAISSAVAGYSSGSYYKKYFPTPRSESKSNWQQAMVLTIALYPSLVLAFFAVLNSISIYYDTVGAVPVSTMLQMALIWVFVSVPLHVLGTIFGRHWMGKYEAPCRVNAIPRPIPSVPWYLSPFFIIVSAGLLPFGSIFIEMYFMFTAFWSYKFYYVYGFMLLVYAILAIVTLCTTVVVVYFVLNSENHHWQWISLLSAGSTAGYVFIYSIFYFVFKTQMTGVLQVSFYFGYTSIFCFTLFLMCGTIGVYGSTLFVNKIYKDVKID